MHSSTSRLRQPVIRQRVILIALALLSLIPVGGLPLWRHVYGFTGDLAPATWVLFGVWFVAPQEFKTWVHKELPLHRRLVLLVSAILFYVLALGSGSFDPYAAGYEPRVLLVLMSLWVLWRGRRLPGLTLLLAFGLLVYSLHGLSSDNLWDYLLDPVMTIVLAISVFRSVKSRRFTSPD